MKKIDINNWPGKKHYLWFKNYPTHFYSITSTIDITKVIEYSKKNNKSFFICFLYLINIGLNNIEEMRLRIINDDIYLFDQIHPAFTVMTKSGVFDNCDCEFYNDFNKFYDITKSKIEKAKQGVDENTEYNDYNRLDQFYYTCLPWIDFTSLTHPMPNDQTITVPRICWGKYRKENDCYKMSLNIQVSHMLVDGYPLSSAFISIQETINNLDKILQ